MNLKDMKLTLEAYEYAFSAYSQAIALTDDPDEISLLRAKKDATKNLMNKIRNEIASSSENEAEFICNRLETSLQDLREKSRNRDLVYKRKVFIFYMNKKISLSEIGRRLNIHHACVYHHLKDMNQNIADNFRYNKELMSYFNKIS